MILWSDNGCCNQKHIRGDCGAAQRCSAESFPVQL